MPPMVQQVALVLGKLLITYVTLYYKDYKDRSTIQKGLVIVEVAYGRLTARGRIIWLWVGLWIPVLRV